MGLENFYKHGREEMHSILKDKKEIENRTGEKCPYTDEELLNFEKQGLMLVFISKEDRKALAEFRKKHKESSFGADVEWKIERLPKDRE